MEDLIKPIVALGGLIALLGFMAQSTEIVILGVAVAGVTIVVSSLHTIITSVIPTIWVVILIIVELIKGKDKSQTEQK